MRRILLLEDELLLRSSVARYLAKYDFDVEEAGTCEAAEAAFRRRRPEVVLADYDLPDGNTLELLPRLKAFDASVPVVLLTGHAKIDLAVRAIKEGAEQFLTKPVDLPALLVVLNRIVEASRVSRNRLALTQRENSAAPDPFLGTSAAIRSLREQALRVAESDGPALILGETGSGKGVLTRWLHAHSARAAEPFVDMNCAGLVRELLENELFGHERGAFTGAVAVKPGLIEVAQKGTLFLDEIGDVDVNVQPRLLKVLEEKRFRRLGDVKDRAVDVRLVAATHHDLEAAMKQNRFRRDLYYRISVLPLRLPPLRERPEDIAILARALLRTGIDLSPQAEQALKAYPWPGNIRELRNVLERAQVLTRKPVLEPADLQLGGAVAEPPGEALSLDEAERRHIERIYRSEHGNVARTAEVLGISRSTLYQRLERYRISIEPA